MRLGCFGKAPCDREYIELQTVQPSTRWLKNWIRDGFKLARFDEEGQSTNSFRESGTRNFLFASEDWDECLVGSLGPSEDQAGRENVLALFVQVPRRVYKKGLRYLPAGLAAAWEAIHDARRNALEAVTLDDFKQELNAVRVPIPSDPTESKREYERGCNDPLDDWIDPGGVTNRLPDLVACLKSKPETAVLRFPVDRGLERAAFQISFWIDLLSRHFAWRTPTPSVFLDPEGADRQRLVLVFGQRSPELYAPLTGPAPMPPELLEIVAHDPLGSGPRSEISYGSLLSAKLPW